jgi:hypothetical protein
VPPVQLPNQRGNHPPIRGTLRVGHIRSTTEAFERPTRICLNSSTPAAIIAGVTTSNESPSRAIATVPLRAIAPLWPSDQVPY